MDQRKSRPALDIWLHLLIENLIEQPKDERFLKTGEKTGIKLHESFYALEQSYVTCIFNWKSSHIQPCSMC